MRICGIEISGSKANLCVVEVVSDEYTALKLGLPKIELSDDNEQSSVKIFRDTILSFFRENKVDHAVIIKRQSKGEYAAGPTTFKIEGIIQLCDDTPVLLLQPNTIASTLKKNPIDRPDNIHKYQHKAFEAAYAYHKKM